MGLTNEDKGVHIDMNAIMDSLSKRRPIFVSEDDFKFEMAMTIKHKYKDCKVRLEYTMNLGDSTNRKNKRHIDIVLFKNKYIIPIELKYRTKELIYEYDEELFKLSNQHARDTGSYSYLNDIKRIETIKGQYGESSKVFVEGYAVLLTNDDVYQKKVEEKGNHVNFSLHPGRKINASTSLKWGKNASEGTKKGYPDNLSVKGEYTFKWESYSDIPQKNGHFYYLCTKVNDSLEKNGVK